VETLEQAGWIVGGPRGAAAKLGLVLSEQFHEITSKQPARKQLVCSAATDPRGTTTSYISLTSIPIQSGDKPLGTPKKTTTERS